MGAFDSIKSGITSSIPSGVVKAYEYVKEFEANNKRNPDIDSGYGEYGTDFVENDIINDKYTLFGRILYGGIGYGAIVVPTNIFKVLFTIIFPPLGEII